MNNIDAVLHEKIHKKMMGVDSDSIFKDRVDTFGIVESILGKLVSGSVLDVGCGNGYASIWLAKNRKNISVTALEMSERAVVELIPKHISHHKVESIVTPKIGSFDSIGKKEEYDFVVAFGALHHSSCLYETMSSIYNSITNDGFLIANEPVMPNSTTHKSYIDKYNIVQNMFGLQIRNGDRNDCFYREAEYIAAAIYSGFDLVSVVDFNKKPNDFFSKIKLGVKSYGFMGLLKRLMGKIFADKSRDIHLDEQQKKYKEAVKNVETKIFIFQKKNNSYIPHLWKKLK